jgi:hypothetical protein
MKRRHHAIGASLPYMGTCHRIVRPEPPPRLKHDTVPPKDMRVRQDPAQINHLVGDGRVADANINYSINYSIN